MNWNDFSRIVDIHIRKYGNDPSYTKWVNDKAWENYRKGDLTESDVENIVRFLKEWNMGRVLGKIIKKLSEDKFISMNIELTKKVKPFFEMSNNYKFNYEILDFHKLKPFVEELFSSISQLWKATSTSKIMHMVNPSLFIMWDDEIRKHLGCDGSANGYTNFLMRMNLEYWELVNDFANIEHTSLIETDSKILQNLNQRVGKNFSITRWIDVYNWTKFTRKEKL